jgi:phage terminase small subunit
VNCAHVVADSPPTIVGAEIGRAAAWRYNGRMLTPRQQRFVAELLKDMDATRAYIRAGYARKGASASAANLLRRPDIQAAIAARQKALAEQFAVSRTRVVAELAKVAFTSIDDFIAEPPEGGVRLDLARSDRAHRAALSLLTVDEYQDPGKPGGRLSRVTIRLASKLHALDSLGRHLGLFAERGAGAIPDNLGDEIRAARKRAWGDARGPHGGE